MYVHFTLSFFLKSEKVVLCLQTIRDLMLLLIVLVLVHGQKIVDIN